MESLFFNLLQVLKLLNEKLAEMLQATEKHNLALRENDLESIKQFTKQLETISAQLKTVDYKREEIQVELEKLFHLPAGAALSEMIKLAPGGIKEELSAIAKSMKQTAAELTRLVELNDILTRQAIFFNNILLSALKPAPATYCPNGQTTEVKVSSLLLNKTI